MSRYIENLIVIKKLDKNVRGIIDFVSPSNDTMITSIINDICVGTVYRSKEELKTQVGKIAYNFYEEEV